MTEYVVGTISLLVSNILLSSYPILIKNYIEDVNIFTQLIIRCIVYIFLCVPIMILNKETQIILSSLIEPKYLFISLVNLVHIYSSYKGFEYLNSGVALTTFYIYPIIQLFLSEFILGTSFNPKILYNLFGSLIGLTLLNIENFGKTSKNIKVGYIAILLASITEAIINVFYKKVNIKNPFTSLYTLYAPSFIIFFVFYIFLKKEQVKKNIINVSILKKIILFNFLIGGLGYAMRLYSLGKISMSWFSTLSFTNGISVFLLGWLLLGEKIKWYHLVGTGIIFYNTHKIRSIIN